MWDFITRGDARPKRRESIVALADAAHRLARLLRAVVARGDVEKDGVAKNRRRCLLDRESSATPSDDDAEFDLGKHASGAGRDHNAVAGSDECGRRLQEKGVKELFLR